MFTSVIYELNTHVYFSALIGALAPRARLLILYPFLQLLIEDYTLRLVLPEGSEVLSVSSLSLPNARISHSSDRRYSFADGPFQSGHPIVLFTARDVVSGPDWPHAGNVVVSFRMPRFALAWKAGERAVGRGVR